MGLVRRYKPEVMVTHDVGGEYGHGAHKVARMLRNTALKTARMRPSCRSWLKSTEHGRSRSSICTWARRTTLSWIGTCPLESMGPGRPSEQLAQEAFLLHVTQQKTEYVVTDEGKTGNARFTLVHSEVGSDVVGGDFFENIPAG